MTAEPADVRLERILRHLEGFTRVIAHDLKAPLANLSSFAQLLPQTVELGEQGSMMAERMVVNARRASRIVDAVVDHARRIGREVDAQPVSLEEVMAAVDAALADLIDDDDDVSLEWHDLPVVAGDRDELVFVFRQLVDNSARYRDPARPVHIRVSAVPVDAGFAISVVDDGPGIPPASHERVFELGLRLVDVAGPIEGSGVGLSTVRVIAENHGGAAFVRAPAEGNGTEVVVQLPAAGS